MATIREVWGAVVQEQKCSKNLGMDSGWAVGRYPVVGLTTAFRSAPGSPLPEAGFLLQASPLLTPHLPVLG